jgi:hypothetical protein
VEEQDNTLNNETEDDLQQWVEYVEEEEEEEDFDELLGRVLENFWEKKRWQR